MSFCFDTKQELCQITAKKKCCQAAELYGMLLFSDTVTADEVRVVSEHVLVINRLFELAHNVCNVNFLLEENRTAYVASLKGESLTRLLSQLHLSFNRVQLRLMSDILEDSCCFQAFLRGVFLVCGSISDPSTGYHVELVTHYYQLSKDLQQLMIEHDIPIKSVVRKSHYVLYIKDSSAIEYFLYFIGAKQAAFEIANIKIYKEIQNRNNRVSNCTEYNIEKSMNAAVQQIKAIENIANKIGLDSLSDELRDVAFLRQSNPSASLGELLKLSHNSISKASLSRRLNKLVEVSNKLEQI